MVIIVVVVLVGGGLIVSLAPRFFESIDKFLDSTGWFGNMTALSDTGMGITIYFADGTSKEIEPQTFSIMPLSLFFEGKEFTKIVYEASAKVNWAGGELTSMTIQGFISSSVRKQGELSKSIRMDNIDKVVSPLPEKDVWFVVTTHEVSNTEIKNELKEHGYGDGQYVVSCVFDVYVTATFDTGQLSGEQGTTIAELEINYSEPAVTALSIKISSQPS